MKKRTAKRLAATALIGAALCCTALACFADERIWIKADINGHSMRFAFDTGSSYTLLTEAAVSRLKLNTTNVPADLILPPGADISKATERCELTVFKNHIKTSIPILNLPSYVNMDVDGLIGWPWVAQNVFQIDGSDRWVTFYNNVPKKARKWAKFPLQTNSFILQMQMRDTNGDAMLVNVDTGSPDGISLGPEKWTEWKLSHKNEPLTLNAVYRPDSGGVVVLEETWAREISFDALKLTEVPIQQAAPVDVGESRYAATFGLAALKRMDFVVDGKTGVVYLHPKTDKPKPYNYNRLGAVFVPGDEAADELLAIVIDGSPAYEAGVRRGDVLLRVNEVDIATWRKDPKFHFSDLWQKPAGTKLNLALKRGDKTFEAAVQLKDILPEAVE